MLEDNSEIRLHGQSPLREIGDTGVNVLVCADFGFVHRAVDDQIAFHTRRRYEIGMADGVDLESGHDRVAKIGKTGGKSRGSGNDEFAAVDAKNEIIGHLPRDRLNVRHRH
jgi:hypothetical protein